MDYSMQAKMAEAAKAQALAGGAIGASKFVSEPALIRATDRIRRITDEFRELRAQLDDHADRVHGEQPENDGKAECAPYRSGALGSLEDAIDRLAETRIAVRDAAERNLGLA